MSKNSKIEWTDHTFNPWIGCTKVSPACDHCYAEISTASRALGVNWGSGKERRLTGASNWKQPIKWDAEAKRLGLRYRVFCASLADVFDNEVPVQWRISLMSLIVATPNLDWLLLTKRIGNANEMLEKAFRAVHHQREGWADNVPRNVWLGATICNQQEADRDIPKLLSTPAAIRFLSIEPMLGPIDLEAINGETVLNPECWGDCACDTLYGRDRGCRRNGGDGKLERRIDWVIVGGESGPKARPMHPDWVKEIRNQCAAADVPFLFKQWGEWAPNCLCQTVKPCAETPRPPPGKMGCMFRCGKKEAGRKLFNVTHDDYPMVK